MFTLIVSIFVTSTVSADYVDTYTFNTYQECKVKREQILNTQTQPTEAVCFDSNGNSDGLE